MNDRILIILGFGKSGTSLISRVFHTWGVNMGDEKLLKAPGKNNPEGYWENNDFNSLDQKLLGDAGASFFTPKVVKHTPKRGKWAKQKIRANRRDGFWGWKNQRTAWTLPVYEPYLDKDHTLIVCAKRDKEATIKSYEAKMDKNPEKLSKLYDQYYQRIKDISKNWSLFYINFPKNLEDNIYFNPNLVHYGRKNQ